MPDCECHCQHGESEYERNTQQTHSQIGKCSGQYCTTASTKDKPKGTKKTLRHIFS
jgi:hypothetical protein